MGDGSQLVAMGREEAEEKGDQEVGDDGPGRFRVETRVDEIKRWWGRHVRVR